MVKVGMIGAGIGLPSGVVTNADLENTLLSLGIDIEPGWIEKKTGIEKRRFCTPDETLPVLCAAAGLRAIDNAALEPDDIDEVIIGTNSTSPDSVPDISTSVQFLMGLTRQQPSYSVHAGCSAGVYGAYIAYNDIMTNHFQSGKKRNIMVITGDTMSNVTAPENWRSFGILADGAAATIYSTVDDDVGIDALIRGAEGRHGKLIRYEGPQQRVLCTDPLTFAQSKYSEDFEMEASKVHGFVVNIMPQCIEAIYKKANQDLQQLQHTTIFPHQMQRNSLNRFPGTIKDKLGHDVRAVYTEGVIKYANTSGSGAFIGLQDAQANGIVDLSGERHEMKRSDPYMVLVFGAGLTWGAMLGKWSLPAATYNEASGDDLISELNDKYQSWRNSEPEKPRIDLWQPL